MLLNRISPEIELSEKSIHNFTDSDWYIKSPKEYVQKNFEATLLFVDFAKAFSSIFRGNMAQILLTYGLSKETVTIIMTLYKNTKAMVCLPDGNTDFFDTAAGILLGDTLVPHIFMISLEYVFRTSIDLIKMVSRYKLWQI